MAETIALYVALYIDEDVTNLLAMQLRQQGFDAVSALDLGLSKQDDEEHLGLATRHNRTVLTYNERDFISLSHKWATEGRTHAGILISDQFSLRQTGELLRRVLNFLDKVTADEMINVVRYLSDFK
jgi:predicted nuclease of predicted toxin-antitoxin system